MALPDWLHFQVDGNPALTVALALAAGMVGQALGHHLRLPKIVLLIGLGVVLGPDVANLVQPDALGTGLTTLVGFAVAVILFEGGMSLELSRLRREQSAIKRLITLGAAVSLALGMAVAWLGMAWSWQLSLLFGTLVIVTGPTVVTPMLRRLRVEHRVSTVLEAEGVLIDAVGAITAAVALELVLRPSGESWAMAVPTIGGRLLFGAVVGVAGGMALALLLRVRNLIPEGLENTFALAWSILVFQLANAVVHESGIAAVTVAGMWVGNSRSHVRRELAEFKEQLTMMLIGMLFVLLVADVRLADVAALGRPGVLVALAIILVVRPLSVALGTWGTELEPRERVFVGWIGPRGIVAAAVASLFGYTLDDAGLAGGTELRALVFLVIATTVVWSGLTGGLAARFLGLRRPSGSGWVVVSDNPLAVILAHALAEAGSEVVLIDPNGRPRSDRGAIKVVSASALDAETTELVDLQSRVGAIAAASSPASNYLFAEKARRHARSSRYPLLLQQPGGDVTAEMVDHLGGEVLFGKPLGAGWVTSAGQDGLTVRWLRARSRSPRLPEIGSADPTFLPLVHHRKRLVEPMTNRTQLRRGSRVAFLVERAREGEWRSRMQDHGWDAES